MATASLHAAAELGGRFAVLTGGPRWIPMLEELIQLLGLSERCAAVRAVPQTGVEIAADPDRAVGALAVQAQACASDDGADAVILGGAGLAGLAPRIQAQVRVRLIDSVAAGVAAAETLARDPGRRCRPPAPVETIGLSDALAAMLRNPTA
jgi:Asp/Glu/hydantoin racemase